MMGVLMAFLFLSAITYFNPSILSPLLAAAAAPLSTAAASARTPSAPSSEGAPSPLPAAAATPAAPASAALCRDVLLHHLDDFVGNPGGYSIDILGKSTNLYLIMF